MTNQKQFRLYEYVFSPGRQHCFRNYFAALGNKKLFCEGEYSCHDCSVGEIFPRCNLHKADMFTLGAASQISFYLSLKDFISNVYIKKILRSSPHHASTSTERVLRDYSTVRQTFFFAKWERNKNLEK